MFKGIVFDLDGTLIDSPLCFQSIRKQLDIPAGELILEHLEKLPKETRAEKHQQLEEIELIAARQARLFPDVRALLNELRARKIYIGIFTRNCRKATAHVVQSLDLTVNMIITREDAPPKPDPTGIYEFLKRWNLKTQELLYVGDFRFDIECGKQAGVKTALFTNGQILDDDWNPDYIISHYSTFWSHIQED